MPRFGYSTRLKALSARLALSILLGFTLFSVACSRQITSPDDNAAESDASGDNQPAPVGSPELSSTWAAATLRAEPIRKSVEGDQPTLVVSTITSDPATSQTPPTANEPSTSCGVLLPIVSESTVQPTSSLNSGETVTSMVPDAAIPAFQRILASPSSVGLVAYELGKEDAGIYFNANVPMPLASIAKIINLVAYANAVQEGSIDPASWIAVADIEAAYLPGSDLGAHRASIAELKNKGLITQDTASIPMEEIPWIMMRYSSNAASDYLQTLIGQEKIEKTILELEISTHTAPCPFLGQFLIVSNHTRAGNDQLAVEKYVEQPQLYGREVMELTESFMNSLEFRQSEGSWRAPIATQRYFAEELNAKSSALDYAGLLEKILRNEIGSDFVNILVRRAFEWPMIFPTNQNLFSSIGYKSGSLPGVLNSAYYGKRLEDGAEVVVVLFFHDLPMQTYRQWRQTLPHDELARWLLSEPQAIETFRSWMNE